MAVVRELLSRVHEIGGDIGALIRRAGLPYAPATLLDPKWSGKLSRAEFAQIYAECTWTLDAHASRQEGRTPLTKPEFDMLCYCVITCRTLREVIARTATFSMMLTPRTAPMTLHIQDGIAEFRMATVRRTRNASAYLSDLTGLSTYHRFFGWLIGEDLDLQAVELRYPAIVDERTASRLMPHRISHDARENCIRFPDHFLDRPVIRTHAELVRLLAHFPFDLEEARSKSTPLSERVAILLGSALADGEAMPTGLQLADRFSISMATFKRRLSAEGTSLSRLKADCRRELSQQLLADRTLAIGEIALRASFSDTTTFSRAFRQWTGKSPDRWRRAHHGKPGDRQSEDHVVSDCHPAD